VKLDTIERKEERKKWKLSTIERKKEKKGSWIP